MLVIRPKNYRPPHERGTPRPVDAQAKNEPDATAAVRSADQVTHSLAPAAEAAAGETVPDAADSSAGDHENIAAEAALQSPEASPAPDADLTRLTAELQAVLSERFEVVRPVSIGGMATIFQLRHRVHGGLFALKLMHAHLLDRAGLRTAFNREAKVLARLGGHPNSVALVDLLDVNGTPALLMPYIEGEDLDQMLKRVGRLDREQTLMLAAQIASLLMFAESLGVTHGDLAPGNIRLDSFGQYRLLDFGLARLADEPAENTDDTHAPPAGTPAYNSPEQVRGEMPDIRSDLYALGAILVEALSGNPLFAADDLAALGRKHLEGDFTLPPEVEADPALRALTRSLLATDRDRRMSSSYELAGALAAFGYELPSFAQSFQPATLEAPRPRRKRLEAAQ